MAKSVLSQPHFHDEAAAFAYLEGKLWPQGPVCPKCGGEGYALKGVMGKATKSEPAKERLGLKKCRACRAQFTVRIGTIFEESRAPLHLWLQAIALMAASKKGVSANQLHRTLGVTLKTAWFMAHRIRMAMAPRAGALRPIAPNTNILMMASSLRDHSFRLAKMQKGQKERVMSVPDAIHLATCIYARDALGISDIAFHTFDDGKSKGPDGKSVPLLSFKAWSEHLAKDPIVAAVHKLSITEPLHPAPMMDVGPKAKQ